MNDYAAPAVVIALYLCILLLLRLRSRHGKPRALEDGIKTVLHFSAPFAHPTREEGPPCFEERFLEPARWLHSVLQEHLPGIAAPEFVDYAYSLSYALGSKGYSIELSFDFHGWQHFEVSILASYRGCSGRRSFNPGKEQKELAVIASAIHRALEEQDEVTDMRWYDYPPEGPDWPFAEQPD
jgi:hypothetical protein